MIKTDTGTRLLRISEVSERVGMSRFKVNELIEKGLFPKPITFGHRTKLWPDTVLDAWVLTIGKELQAAQEKGGENE